MNRYGKAMASERRRTIKRRALEDGEPPRDCYDIMERDLDEVRDEQMEYDYYISDGENND